MAPATRSASAAHSSGNETNGTQSRGVSATAKKGSTAPTRPSFRLGQEGADLRLHEIDRHQVVAPFGDDEVGVALRGLDELQMHRAHARFVLSDYLVQRAAALGEIALQPPDEANV